MGAHQARAIARAEQTNKKKNVFGTSKVWLTQSQFFVVALIEWLYVTSLKFYALLKVSRPDILLGSPQSDVARDLIRANNPNPCAWDSSVNGNYHLGMVPGVAPSSCSTPIS
jgi:hypothetical protein